MAKRCLGDSFGIRPAVDKSAPWRPKFKRPRHTPAIDRAVVYVIGPDQGGWCKVGRTTNLKSRLAGLSRDINMPLHVLFWLELYERQAKQVEQMAIKKLAGIMPAFFGREIFRLAPEVVATAVINAAHDKGYSPLSMAGFPGALDYETSDVEHMLATETYTGDTLRNGRLDREVWAPQGRFIGY